MNVKTLRILSAGVLVAALVACGGGVPNDVVLDATRSISDQAEAAKAALAACANPPPDAGAEMRQQLCERVPKALDAIKSTSDTLQGKVTPAK